MCNKLCNWVFCILLLKCPALAGKGALAGIRASRVWTVAVLWTGRGCPESGRCAKNSKGQNHIFANLHSDSSYKIVGNITIVSSYDKHIPPWKTWENPRIALPSVSQFPQERKSHGRYYK